MSQLRHKKILLIFFIGLCISILFNIKTAAKDEYPYYIKVNKQQNCVTVYAKDEMGNYTVPIKAMTCSTGVDTPLGTYNTMVKYRWKLLMGNVWGQYSTRIVRGILFHSVWYYEMKEDTLSAREYNKLGSSASHGCIRLTVIDAKWIYDNCPVGTTVEIYNDKDPGPLGKPETILLKSGTGWDPTDPKDNNPFKDKIPVITGASNKSIPWGSEIDLKKEVKATSTSGTDITKKIEVKGDIDIYQAGKYQINYIVTDAIGRTANKTITVTVKESKEKPRFEGITNRVINDETEVNREFALKGVSAYLATKKLEDKAIKVKIEKESDDIYKIEYKITAENNKTTTKTVDFVIDRTPPVMEGITHREITEEELKAGNDEIKKLALKGIKVKDDYSNKDQLIVDVKVKTKDDYSYLITYNLKDEVGNLTSETVQFTYFKDIRIEGISNYHNLPYNTNITKDFVKENITVTNNLGEDCSDLLTVKINSFTDYYKITYTAPNQDGSTVSVVSYFLISEETDSALEQEDKAEDKDKGEDKDKDENKDNLNSIFYADVTHDGVKDKIEVDFSGLNTNNEVVLNVYSGTNESNIIFTRSASTSHEGWNSYYLYMDIERAYLMEYNPYMLNGGANYSYRLFSLDNAGKVNTILHENVDFNLSPYAFRLDSKALYNFVFNINLHLKKSFLILSTINGEVRMSNEDTVIRTKEELPWMNDYSVLFEENDSLEDKLKKIEQYKMMN